MTDSQDAMEFAEQAKRDVEEKEKELLPLIKRIESYIAHNRIYESVYNTLRSSNNGNA